VICIQKSSVKIDNKKSKAMQRIRRLRGKYKYLNLMEALVEGRKDERQRQIKSGEAKFSDWESAKKRIRNRSS